MALSELYRVLRVYVNFFQPSLKLLSKERNGAKVSKKYDTAKTPHQRFIMVESVDQKIKDALNEQYKALDPVPLLEKLKILQSKLFQYAWSCNDTPQETKESVAMMNNLMALPESKNRSFNIKKDSLDLAPKKTKLHHYRHTKKNDSNKRPRDWKTRKDPFEQIWDEIKLKLELSPEKAAKSLLDVLIIKYPDDFKFSHLRTLQRRVSHWRLSQHNQEERLREIMRRVTAVCYDQKNHAIIVDIRLNIINHNGCLLDEATLLALV